jgi:hypothetical protein
MAGTKKYGEKKKECKNKREKFKRYNSRENLGSIKVLENSLHK